MFRRRLPGSSRASAAYSPTHDQDPDTCRCYYDVQGIAAALVVVRHPPNGDQLRCECWERRINGLSIRSHNRANELNDDPPPPPPPPPLQRPSKLRTQARLIVVRDRR